MSALEALAARVEAQRLSVPQEEVPTGSPRACHTLVGLFCIAPREGGHWQGSIRGALSDDVFLVQWYGWGFGTPTYSQPIALREMLGWRFYDDEDDWRSAGTEIAAIDLRGRALFADLTPIGEGHDWEGDGEDDSYCTQCRAKCDPNNADETCPEAVRVREGI